MCILVSVCIATYNGERYIISQLQSVLAQLDSADEVIISDDGSTDKTVDLIRAFNDKRVKVFEHEKKNNSNPGRLKFVYYLNRNFENAIRESTGDYIFIADQDDIWLPQKVETVKSLLNNCDLVLHDCIIVNENLEVIEDSHFNIKKPTTGLLRTLFKPTFKGCCMAFTKNLKRYILPFPDIAIEYDTWIGICAIKYAKIIIEKRPFIQWRRHSSNISPHVGKSTNNVYIKILRRLIILYVLLFKCKRKLG